MAGGARIAALLVAAVFCLPAMGEGGDLYGSWTQQQSWTDSTGPKPRGWMRVTYDPVNRKMVLIGGSGSEYYNDIWFWDPALDDWMMIEPHVGCSGIQDHVPPTPRDEHVVEYDPVNHLYWMFAGSGFGCTGSSRTAQFGTTTLQVVDSTLTAGSVDFYQDWTVTVGGSKAYVAAYSPDTKTLTLATPISGLTQGTSYRLHPQRGGGTWYYAPGTGTWASFNGPHWDYDGPNPEHRLSPAFAYSSKDRVILMFGGGTRNDTWALDVETMAWVKMLAFDATGSPGRRAQLQNSMVYDQARDVFVLFGGECKSTSQCGSYNALLNDTWEYALATNTWTKRQPAVSPSPRKQHQMSYDPVKRVTVLFGGKGTSGYLNDTWVYDGTAWTQLQPGVSPPTTNLGSMVYDPHTATSIMYHLRKLWTLRVQSLESDGNPVPSITSLAPSSAMAGSPGFTLTVNGGNFVTSSVVRWNGANRPTTVVSGAQLRASIASTDIAASGSAQVTVFNPAPGGGTSNVKSFGVNVTGKDLVIEGLTVSPQAAGAAEKVTVSHAVANRGTTTVTETYSEKIYLSSKSALDGTARLLGTTHGHTLDLVVNATHANSQTVTIPADTGAGSYFILVQADAKFVVAEANEGNNVAATALTVNPPPANQVIVDNAPAGVQDAAGGRTFTGKWCKSGASGPYGTDSLYSCGSGLDAYRLTPSIPAAGLRDVYVWWTSHSNRSTAVPISVTHAAGTAARTFNQRSGGGQWVLHGRYSFGAGTGGHVEISDANGQAAADAVRFVPVSP
jgi:hypothetical protein